MTTIDDVFEAYLDVGRGKPVNGIPIKEMTDIYEKMRSELSETERIELDLMIHHYHLQTS